MISTIAHCFSHDCSYGAKYRACAQTLHHFLQELRARPRPSKNEKFRLSAQIVFSFHFQEVENVVQLLLDTVTVVTIVAAVTFVERGVDVVVLLLRTHATHESGVLGVEPESAAEESANEKRILGAEEEKGVGTGVKSVTEDRTTQSLVNSVNWEGKIDRSM